MSAKFASATAYPLAWPEGFSRTTFPKRSSFKVTLNTAVDNVTAELQRFAKASGCSVKNIIISSNYCLGETSPKQPGVAVYFVWDGIQTCIAVDLYDKLQDNLQAVFYCIEAERTKLRHGGLNLVRAAFRGYASLPPPSSSAKPRHWREVLQYPHGFDIDQVKVLYRTAQLAAHPDRNKGVDKGSAEINAAWEQAKKELGFR